ncbi:hypothetical protein BKA61DRAFT_9403 [Leptodontidium sp. MPI-SDFR-AT-0119]|nr:hypothetical protein BKA61DRAFT_9403 [Leptodontidium sp. MPI-SDFR-AT-0119]
MPSPGLPARFKIDTEGVKSQDYRPQIMRCVCPLIQGLRRLQIKIACPSCSSPVITLSLSSYLPLPTHLPNFKLISSGWSAIISTVLSSSSAFFVLLLSTAAPAPFPQTCQPLLPPLNPHHCHRSIYSYTPYKRAHELQPLPNNFNKRFLNEVAK